MFCGNIFTSTDLQNHKKNHMKKSQKRFHRVYRALFLSLSNAFEEQKFMPKISPKNSLFSQNCLWGTINRWPFFLFFGQERFLLGKMSLSFLVEKWPFCSTIQAHQ